MLARIMGVDYGLKRIGIALSDLLKITANPFATIETSTFLANADEILRIALENNVCEIAIGLPVNMDGTYGKMAETVKNFSQKLIAKTDLPIMFVNESLSTMEAIEVLKKNKIKFNHKDKGLRDRVSAAIILERYLESKNNLISPLEKIEEK
ncbi:MAG: Holliday junction resolvase RuvX [Elusimicrobiota bacterium]|jgi:putative Holliday junction resolvase|nr:Holliday junction resolvase RuvX [Elusimicrobiota bacterium]